jgi:adenylosuccinate lyase
MIDRYKCPEIAIIWSEPFKYLTWTRIELIFLRYLKGVDIPLPKTFETKWIEEIARLESKTNHDVAAFVEWLEGYVANAGFEDYARWVHYGLTSSDILDTAFSLQIMQTNWVLQQLASHVTAAIAILMGEHGEIEMIGRTHGQAAEPIVFGSKLNAYIQAFHHFLPGQSAYYGKISGSVGDSKYFKPEVAKSTIEHLGLAVCPVQDGQVIHRAVYAHCMNQWALLASVIAKIATDIRLLSQTGIEEVHEYFGESQVGSSSMPQKRNPIYSENLCGLARIIRGYQTTVMQNIELWNERDISHSSAERITFPDASILLGFMIKRLGEVLQHLEVNEVSMCNNLSKYSHLMESQSRMLKYIQKGMSRKEAYEKVRSELGQ